MQDAVSSKCAPVPDGCPSREGLRGFAPSLPRAGFGGRGWLAFVRVPFLTHASCAVVEGIPPYLVLLRTTHGGATMVQAAQSVEGGTTRRSSSLRQAGQKSFLSLLLQPLGSVSPLAPTTGALSHQASLSLPVSIEQLLKLEGGQ